MFLYMSPTRESSNIYYSIHDIFELYTTRLLALSIKYYFHLLCLHIMGKNCCRQHDFMLLVTYPRWLSQSTWSCSYNFCINALNKIFSKGGFSSISLFHQSHATLSRSSRSTHAITFCHIFHSWGCNTIHDFHALSMSWSIMSSNQLEWVDGSLLLWLLICYPFVGFLVRVMCCPIAPHLIVVVECDHKACNSCLLF